MKASWSGQRVLVTGHTGFKGAWLCALLQALGARVTAVALAPPEGPNLFRLLAPWDGLQSIEADLRDPQAAVRALDAAQPAFVFHLAAQAIVRRGYSEPVETFRSNVDATVHLLQAMRGRRAIRAAVLVTSDKVYRNDGLGRRFVESDPLGGADPYSASKAAAEIAIASWRASFGAELPAIGVARAGNVLGGGDFGEARLVPDIARALAVGQPLEIRHPGATRPWQHVLDVLRGYLLYAQRLATGASPPALNFGPEAPGQVSVRELLRLYEAASGTTLPVRMAEGPHPPEAPHLALDPTLARESLGWQLRRTLERSVQETAQWYGAWQRGEDMRALTLRAVAQELG